MVPYHLEINRKPPEIYDLLGDGEEDEREVRRPIKILDYKDMNGTTETTRFVTKERY